MSAPGAATLGPQCADRKLGSESIGLYCGEEQKPEIITPVTAYGGSRVKAPSREDIYRDDMDIIALVVAAIESGIIR